VLQASGAFTYTPGADYHGPDAFTYRAGDGVLESNTATVTLTVTHVNRPPVAVNDAATTSRNTAVTVNLVANDYDTDGSVVAGTASIATGPRYGKVANKGDGRVVYTPNRRFRGTDSFTYTVKDDAGAASNLATVSVKVK
jgi:hypothetical protein